MTTEIDRVFNLHQAALAARGYRGQVLASNIANADTPGYRARDVDFKTMLANTAGMHGAPQMPLLRTSERHMESVMPGDASLGGPLLYRAVTQASIDNNTVDVNVERAQFADNAMRYEASLTFISAKIKNLMAAIQG